MVLFPLLFLYLFIFPSIHSCPVRTIPLPSLWQLFAYGKSRLCEESYLQLAPLHARWEILFVFAHLFELLSGLGSPVVYSTLLIDLPKLSLTPPVSSLRTDLFHPILLLFFCKQCSFHNILIETWQMFFNRGLSLWTLFAYERIHLLGALFVG